MRKRRTGKKYPTCACLDCLESVRAEQVTNIAEFKAGICGVCGKQTGVTELRNFGHPSFPGFSNGRR